jgi:predicted ATPase/DNA-binding CsgD family transcriptional regulator/predicted Ser/Thr protein kinase
MIGTTLLNRYHIEAQLGQGGMGIVYRAQDTLLNRPIAIKVLTTAGLGSTGKARLLVEAQAAARLNHPNIVAVYDAGEADGQPFIVMELVEGQSLRSYQPQTLAETLHLAQQICAALEHAHTAGILHRDLKPENIILTKTDTLKLMDFGLARSADMPQLTEEGTIMGTLSYLAPELIEGEAASIQSDLYALGVILYELTTGRSPFSSDTVMALVSQQLHAPVTPPSAHNAEIPVWLDELILRLLSKQPEARPASAGEVLKVLVKRRYVESLPTPATNLPAHLSKFIGREKELSQVKARLAEARLVTLTGPGGIGKTRLSLQVAQEVLPAYANGVWLVELAPLSEPQLVVQEVLLALGLREEPTRSKLATLSEYLQTKNLLLVLDNCEHLLMACAELVEQLLRVCPRLSILATSREVLGIGGETVWQVPPLSLPDLHQPLVLENLTRTEAGQLFIERAQAVRSDFQLTATTAEAIAQVCHRLDGIPLAIELAAARVKLLTVSQIATRLDDCFRLLTGGSRTVLPRHRTLQATIDWSYDLLTEPEQRLFRWLAVFAGGFSLEVTEAVVSDSARLDAFLPNNVLELLSHLVDKSLVIVTQDGEARYWMLEIIRQYARERLLASGELDQIRWRHLAYYLQLAEDAELKLRSAEQLIWLNRLEIEHDNLRAALAWSLESEATKEGLRLAGALSVFWDRRGYLSEGSQWLERVIANTHQNDLILAKALIRAGHLAWQQSNHEQALTLVEQSLALCRQYDDKKGTARSLYELGVIAHWQGDRGRGGSLLEESLSLFREIKDELNIIEVLLFLADIRLRQGDNEQAVALWQESLTLSQKLGDNFGISFALSGLGEVARRQGDYKQAVIHFQQALTLTGEQKSKVQITFTLEALGITIAEQGQSEWAARLWGAAEALRETVRAPLPSSYHPEYAPYLKVARTALGEEVFTAVWAEGRALTLEQTIALAMSVPVVATPGPTTPTETPPFGLTARELEVLRLVAAGLTDAQVAEKLIISPRTVSKHLQAIYGKLHLSSRSAATRFAIEHNLV